jgi:hypothetical protein
MNRTTVLAVAAIALAACGGPASEHTPPAAGGAPGDSIDLSAVYKDALIGAPGGGTGVTWELTGVNPSSALQAALDNGLSLSATGRLQLPGCGVATAAGGVLPLVVMVTARSGTALLLQVNVTVDERFVSSSVACVIPTAGATCQDPATTGLVFETGSAPQFYSRTLTTCRSMWTPDLPAGACPATAGFEFCR